jgi:hypothetical protein
MLGTFAPHQLYFNDISSTLHMHSTFPQSTTALAPKFGTRRAATCNEAVLDSRPGADDNGSRNSVAASEGAKSGRRTDTPMSYTGSPRRTILVDMQASRPPTAKPSHKLGRSHAHVGVNIARLDAVLQDWGWRQSARASRTCQPTKGGLVPIKSFAVESSKNVSCGRRMN